MARGTVGGARRGTIASGLLSPPESRARCAWHGLATRRGIDDHTEPTPSTASPIRRNRKSRCSAAAVKGTRIEFRVGCDIVRTCRAVTVSMLPGCRGTSCSGATSGRLAVSRTRIARPISTGCARDCRHGLSDARRCADDEPCAFAGHAAGFGRACAADRLAGPSCVPYISRIIGGRERWGTVAGTGRVLSAALSALHRAQPGAGD